MSLPALARDCASFIAFVLRRWRDDRCPQIAGSLTFTTLLALVPLFTVVVAMLSVLPLFEAVMTQIKIFLLVNLVPEIAGKIITVYMTQFAEAAGRLTKVSLAALFAMSLAMLLTVDHALNAIWRTSRRRPFWLSVAGYSVLLATGPVLVGAGLWATTWLAVESLGHLALSSRTESAVLGSTPVAVSALALFMAYRFLPNRHVPLGHALAGGILGALAFEAMKVLFTAWIRLVPTYHLVYGAFAAIPIFMLWLYFSWLVVLFGAEFAAALTYWRQRLWRRQATVAERFRSALAVLGALAASAAPAVRLTALRDAEAIPMDELEDLLDRFEAAGIARRSIRGWQLVRPLEAVSLGDVYQAAQPDPGTLSPEEWAKSSAELGRLTREVEVALRSPVAPPSGERGAGSRGQ